MADYFFTLWQKMADKKFGHVKKKQYLCSVKEIIKKHIESETELNKQTLDIRKMGIKFCISLLYVGIALLIFAIIMVIISI